MLWALITFGHLPPEGRWSTHLLLAALLLVATHLAATALPARRLSRIEPMPILRDE